MEISIHVDQVIHVPHGLKSYQGLVSHQGIPDAGHGLSNAQVGVKLVTVEAGHELGQERGQLLSSLGRNHMEAKSCSLKAGGGHVYKNGFWMRQRSIVARNIYGTLREFHMA